MEEVVMSSATQKMEYMDIKKLVLNMSFPIVISMVIQALYNIVDSIFVAMISPQALTAVSLCYPVQTIIIAFACGTAVGFNTLLSRFLGEKRYADANNTVMHGMLLSIFNWLLFAMLGILFSNAFLKCYTSDAKILEMGNSYIRICTIFSFGVFIQITYERIMQATGNAIYNMVMQSLGAIANIILDPIFIFGYFGLPALGVTGAAIATVIGQTLGMFCGYLLAKYRVDDLEVKIGNFKFDRSIIINIYRVGIPAIIMQSILSFMTVFMNLILAPFSELSISVFSIYYKLQNFMNMAVLGVSNALIPILSYNFGAKRNDRVKDAVRFSLFLSIGIMIIGTIVFELFPYSLMGLFCSNDQMYVLGIPCLRIISLSFVFSGINMILCSCLQALNHPNESLIITSLRQLILLIPLTYVLAHTFGLDVAWFSFVVTECICALFAFLFWHRLEKEL